MNSSGTNFIKTVIVSTLIQSFIFSLLSIGMFLSFAENQTAAVPLFFSILISGIMGFGLWNLLGFWILVTLLSKWNKGPLEKTVTIFSITYYLLIATLMVTVGWPKDTETIPFMGLELTQLSYAAIQFVVYTGMSFIFSTCFIKFNKESLQS